MHRDQRYLGRAVVMLKRRCEDLSGLTQKELLGFFEVVQKLEGFVKKTFTATMYNWACLMNDVYRTKPYAPQVHWHFIPRYDHPVEFAGKVFGDPNFGNRSLPPIPENQVAVATDVFEKILTEFRKMSALGPQPKN